MDTLSLQGKMLCSFNNYLRITLIQWTPVVDGHQGWHPGTGVAVPVTVRLCGIMKCARGWRGGDGSPGWGSADKCLCNLGQLQKPYRWQFHSLPKDCQDITFQTVLPSIVSYFSIPIVRLRSTEETPQPFPFPVRLLMHRRGGPSHLEPAFCFGHAAPTVCLGAGQGALSVSF